MGPEHELRWAPTEPLPEEKSYALDEPDPIRNRLSTRPPLKQRLEEIRREHDWDLEWEDDYTPRR